MSRTTIRWPLPLSTFIAPLALRIGTLNEKAVGGPIRGLPMRLHNTRSIAGALDADQVVAVRGVLIGGCHHATVARIPTRCPDHVRLRQFVRWPEGGGHPH